MSSLEYRELWGRSENNVGLGRDSQRMMGGSANVANIAGKDILGPTLATSHLFILRPHSGC